MSLSAHLKSQACLRIVLTCTTLQGIHLQSRDCMSDHVHCSAAGMANLHILEANCTVGCTYVVMYVYSYICGDVHHLPARITAPSVAGSHAMPYSNLHS